MDLITLVNVTYRVWHVIDGWQSKIRNTYDRSDRVSFMCCV